ncbi:MAG: hypothetical protein GX073_09920 [Firmicutes bacterium]|nr:hypothetical protein [Bacillota bacterium]
MRREMRILMPIIFLVFVFGTTFAIQKSHDIIVTIPEIAELELSTDSIDLGSFLVGSMLQERVVSTTPLRVTYRCNHRDGWALKVSATAFQNAVDPSVTIPVDYLYFGTEPDKTDQRMSETEVVVASGLEPVNTSTEIYYAMELPENAYAGEYSSTVTYTLVTL